MSLKDSLGQRVNTKEHQLKTTLCKQAIKKTFCA